MNIGILGSGQLGRMMALAGANLGFQFHFFDAKSPSLLPVPGTMHQADYSDFARLRSFATLADVVTYETENVPISAGTEVNQISPLLPGLRSLQVSQDRLLEKEFLRSLNIPTADFRAVTTLEDLQSAVKDLGLPAVLKTRRSGYDGKGQIILRTEYDIEKAWHKLCGESLVVERWISFCRELSIVAVRDCHGNVAYYALTQNNHTDGILRMSISPAPGESNELEKAAQEIAFRVLTELNHVGVLTIEFFEVEKRLIVNEIAPRVHNSGHWTIEGAKASQFENHVRAIAGLPLGSTESLGKSVMVNLIGQTPNLSTLLAMQDAHVHLYGKPAAAGRKLGHVTFCGLDNYFDASNLVPLMAPMGDASVANTLRHLQSCHLRTTSVSMAKT